MERSNPDKKIFFWEALYPIEVFLSVEIVFEKLN